MAKINAEDVQKARAELLPIFHRHGYDVFRRATGEISTAWRDKERLKSEIEQRESELEELKTKRIDFLEKKPRKDKDTPGGIEILGT